MPRGRFFSRLVCALLVGAQVVFAVLAPQPAKAWGEFTLKDEKELGEKFNVLVRSRLPIVQDTEIVDYITRIVQRLTRSMPAQPFPFTVSVIRHSAVNAFACPGGYIFVHTGLILAMSAESEVAGVLAHEMAHVTQRHIAQRIESSQWISLLSLAGALAGVFLGGQGSAAAMSGAMAAGQAAMLNYSREHEREADQVGMNYLTRSGYPAQGMVSAFKVLSRKQWLMGSVVPTYLSTHPSLNERVRDMGIRVSRLTAPRNVNPEDKARFLRIQALIRARYSDPQLAAHAFSEQMSGPDRCMALMGMGVLHSRQNRIADATRSFDAALACAPDDALVVREAGCFHYTKGNRVQAAALLERAVSLNRNDTLALFYYARSLDDMGRSAEAADFMRQVLLKEPEDPEVHESLARLYGKTGAMFSANIHMAYTGLYTQNGRRIRQFLDKAKGLAKSPAENAALEKFDKTYKERQAFWK